MMVLMNKMKLEEGWMWWHCWWGGLRGFRGQNSTVGGDLVGLPLPSFVRSGRFSGESEKPKKWEEEGNSGFGYLIRVEVRYRAG